MDIFSERVSSIFHIQKHIQITVKKYVKFFARLKKQCSQYCDEQNQNPKIYSAI